MHQSLLFLWLLMGHFVFDWLLQTHWMSVNKSKARFPLAVHSLVYALGVYLTASLYLQNPAQLTVFIILFATHLFLDDYRFHQWWMIHIKRMPEKTVSQALWMVICIDQIWHLLVLFLIIYII